MADNRVDNLEYTRRLYDSVVDWYNSADSKAQKEVRHRNSRTR
jgi:hypothetical protein